MTRLYILGAGGMGSEALDLLRALGRDGEVEGWAEENSRGGALEGRPILDVKELPAASRLVGAIGSLRRRQLLDRLQAQGHVFETLVDPRAIVSASAVVGEGSIVMAGAVVSARASVGRSCILNFFSSISHDAALGDGCTVCPGVRIGGHSRVGAQTWLGIGAVLKDRVQVGDRCFLGAGACVVDDIPAGSLAYGVPARVVRAIDVDRYDG